MNPLLKIFTYTLCEQHPTEYRSSILPVLKIVIQYNCTLQTLLVHSSWNYSETRVPSIVRCWGWWGLAGEDSFGISPFTVELEEIIDSLL